MPASAVVTVRLPPALLAALKNKAAREARTVSAVIVRLVREDVLPHAEPKPSSRRRPRSTSGMFADFEAPELDELKALRRAFSKVLLAPASSRAKTTRARGGARRAGRA